MENEKFTINITSENLSDIGNDILKVFHEIKNPDVSAQVKDIIMDYVQMKTESGEAVTALMEASESENDFLNRLFAFPVFFTDKTIEYYTNAAEAFIERASATRKSPYDKRFNLIKESHCGYYCNNDENGIYAAITANIEIFSLKNPPYDIKSVQFSDKSKFALSFADSYYKKKFIKYLESVNISKSLTPDIGNAKIKTPAKEEKIHIPLRWKIYLHELDLNSVDTVLGVINYLFERSIIGFDF